jgi:SAM-dependent methyltransferase
VVDRRTYLPDRARGLRVVHLGCVDEHLTRARSGTGDLLHEELAKVAKTLVGVDVSGAGIDLMRSLVPGDYVVGDVEALDRLELPDACDLVIAAELIEHLGAPALFLDGLRAYLGRTGATALITTPNAYSWTNSARFALRRREWVHPDHRLVYTPVTLQRTIERAGLTIDSFRVHAWRRGPESRRHVRDAIDRVVLRWNPWLGVGIVVEVRA